MIFSVKCVLVYACMLRLFISYIFEYCQVSSIMEGGGWQLSLHVCFKRKFSIIIIIIIIIIKITTNVFYENFLYELEWDTKGIKMTI